MRQENSSCDPETSATRWVEGIIHEIEQIIPKGIRRPTGRPDSIEDVQQRDEMDAKLEEPSQIDGRLLNSLEETPGIATAKKKRGRPKKISTPPMPLPDEGVLTRSYIGKPGLLAKINEVQSKAAVTKSPVKVTA